MKKLIITMLLTASIPLIGIPREINRHPSEQKKLSWLEKGKIIRNNKFKYYIPISLITSSISAALPSSKTNKHTIVVTHQTFSPKRGVENFICGSALTIPNYFLTPYVAPIALLLFSPTNILKIIGAFTGIGYLNTAHCLYKGDTSAKINAVCNTFASSALLYANYKALKEIKEKTDELNVPKNMPLRRKIVKP